MSLFPAGDPENPTSPELEDLEGQGSFKLEGWWLKLSQFHGLIIKRFHCAKRNTKGLFSQILLPAFFVCVAMTVALSVPEIGELYLSVRINNLWSSLYCWLCCRWLKHVMKAGSCVSQEIYHRSSCLLLSIITTPTPEATSSPMPTKTGPSTGNSSYGSYKNGAWTSSSCCIPTF